MKKPSMVQVFAARRRLAKSHKAGAGSVRAIRRNMIRSKFAGLNVNVGK